MARRLRRSASPVPITRLLLLAAVAVAVTIAFAAPAAEDHEDEGQLRVSVQYPSEEESQWLDLWAEKYRAKEPGSGFSVQPATDEESAYLNRIFSGSKNSGYEGRIEFDQNDRPRLVVDKFHTGGRSSEPNDNLKKNKEGGVSRRARRDGALGTSPRPSCCEAADGLVDQRNN